MTPEFGWLIEFNDHRTGHLWIRVITQPGRADIEFTPHAEVALRFAREEDAFAFIYLHPRDCINCRPTSHQFGV